MLPLVALVGRPNVGKSTIFNVLTRTRDALVADIPGVTRDRHYGICRLIEERPFVIVDTGGLGGDPEGLQGLTEQQAGAAIQEADVLVFVVDARDGAVAQDQNVLQHLRRSGKPVLLAVNKIDGVHEEVALAEFAAFGLGEPLSLSAAHKHGIDDLLDAVEEHLPPELTEEEIGDPNRIRIAVVGRPNVGKSTLVNRLLGEDRVIASDVPGTTRDSIAIDMERDGVKYRLVDTAGIRRRSRVDEMVEKISVIKSLQAMAMSQVAICMIDGQEGVTDQDATVLGHVLDSGRALVIAINKWDGLEPDQRERILDDVSRKLAFVSYATVVTISAKHGSGLRELFRAIGKAHESAMRDFSTSEMTRAIEIAYENFQPPVVRGHSAKLRYAHPAGKNPPTIVIHGSRVKTLPDSYKRYLENFLRQRFKLVGTPLRLEFRDGKNPYEGKTNVLTDSQRRKRRRLMRHVKGK